MDNKTLDYLISVKIFGMKILNESHNIYNQNHRLNLPEYSANILHAWKVIDVLHKLNKAVHFELLKFNDWQNENGCKYTIKFYRYTLDSQVLVYSSITGNDLPRMICTGALQTFDELQKE